MSRAEYLTIGKQIEIVQSYFPAVLAAIPRDTDLPVTRPESKPEVFKPQSFAELKASRADLLAFRKVFGRTPELQALYFEALERHQRERSTSTDGLSSFERGILEKLQRKQAVLEHNMYPYEMPAKISPMVMWYPHGTPRETRALELATALMFEDLTPNDVVVIKNGIYNKSVPTIDHDHVFLDYSVISPADLNEPHQYQLKRFPYELLYRVRVSY